MNSMTYKIKYLPLAVQDLNDIARYLSGFYPKTASRVLKEMRDKITKLGDNPKMCEIYPLDPVYRECCGQCSTMIPRPFGLGIFCGGRYRTCTRSGLPFRSSCLPVQPEKEQ